MNALNGTFTFDQQSPMILAFIVLVLGLLIIDLFVLRRKLESPTMKQAFLWTGFYILVAMSFCGWIWERLGPTSALTFLTGYVVEMSLSIDNLFVFILVFASFKIHAKFQHRVLFWGILGALIMRAICIFVGVSALQKFEWLTFVFAAVLIWAGIKALNESDDDDDENPSEGFVARSIRKIIPIDDNYQGKAFIVKKHGQWLGTPLLLSLILIEISDVIFAVDSIPAVLAISHDPFIVYTSNIFAILGLRSLYFVLASMVNLFRHLEKAISFILVFIGVKMGIDHWWKIPSAIALSVILGALALGIGLSLVHRDEKKP